MIEPGSEPLEIQTPRRREPNPWTVAFVVLIVTLIGFSLIGPFIGLAIAYPFYDGKPLDYINDIANPIGNESMKVLYYIVQGCTTFFGLAVIPALFWKAMTRKPIFSLFKGTPLKPVHFLLIIGIVFFYLGFMSTLVEWNKNIDLPDGAFETWAKTLEEQLSEVTKFLTSFTTFGQYLLGVFVIAVLAGIGEEIVFRGLLQPQLFKATGNIHFAIWVSAIFFSALHLQFYGFFPRVFLGALFGYLYYWSGNLFIPMFAHFVNNFLAVSSIYLGFSEVPGMEESEEQVPWYAVVFMTAVCGVLIYTFYKQFQKNTDDIRA
jgi:membrane protease YdiL (CAAX protease family)